MAWTTHADEMYSSFSLRSVFRLALAAETLLPPPPSPLVEPLRRASRLSYPLILLQFLFSMSALTNIFIVRSIFARYQYENRPVILIGRHSQTTNLLECGSDEECATGEVIIDTSFRDAFSTLIIDSNRPIVDTGHSVFKCHAKKF